MSSPHPWKTSSNPLETSKNREETHDGLLFRNHTLAYWVDYVRHLGGKDRPVIIVQTRCDHPEDETVCAAPQADLFEHFAFRKILHYSARTDRGRAALDDALADAAGWLRSREGIAVIGAGRDRVRQRLEAMLDADAAVAPEARQYRTITQEHFRALCAEADDVSSPEQLLAFLHNAGTVFHRPGRFHDEIIVDQSWVLDAIYAVFHRDSCYRHIRRQKGRFTRSELDVWVWRERGHGDEDQELFLSMMQSCGICFPLRRREFGEDAEVEYVAPDLLPERAEIEIEMAQKWDADAPIQSCTFGYAMLHPGLMRSIISRVGENAGLAAEYWKGGVYVYETQTRSRGMIEEEMTDGWRGLIHVRTQKGQAVLLLQRLMALVRQEQDRAGLTPVETIASGGERRPLPKDARPVAEPSLSFAQEPAPAPEWCVSYAWGDDKTPEGLKREEIVDRLCVEAETRGIRILRDKADLGLGERISKFMRRIGRADRVFIILSDKYLKSTACMFELCEVWRNTHHEDVTFLDRIRVYTLPCARVWTLSERMNYAIHWKERYAEVDNQVRVHGYDLLGDQGSKEFRLMAEFSRNVSDILALVVDTIQPCNFDDFVKYGFDYGFDGPPSYRRPS